METKSCSLMHEGSKRPVYVPASANQISKTKYKRNCKIYQDTSTGNIYFYLNLHSDSCILIMNQSELEEILKFEEGVNKYGRKIKYIRSKAKLRGLE